eukprot:5598427-Amphidinium_carterae.1
MALGSSNTVYTVCSAAKTNVNKCRQEIYSIRGGLLPGGLTVPDMILDDPLKPVPACVLSCSVGTRAAYSCCLLPFRTNGTQRAQLCDDASS